MTKTESPLVSIVTPTYNSAGYLEDLLRSVEAQDYPRIEHIVIDDGSTDDGATIALLKRYPRVKWWSRANRGQYATLNEGFRAATGEFITTISGDDVYADTGAVGAMARFLSEHAECDVVHGYTQHIDENGKPLAVQPYQSYPYWMLTYNLGFIFHCSLLTRRARLIEDDLLFDESLRYTGDGDWMARLYLKNYRFHGIERYIGAYRHHAQQVSTITTSDQRERALRSEERTMVDRRCGQNRILRHLVDAYSTLQQRRLKAISAWQIGGGAGVWGIAHNWFLRKPDGE
jgi:glycosyltransferase involved in cell wall biosynthesis